MIHDILKNFHSSKDRLAEKHMGQTSFNRKQLTLARHHKSIQIAIIHFQCLKFQFRQQVIDFVKCRILQFEGSLRLFGLSSNSEEKASLNKNHFD